MATIPFLHPLKKEENFDIWKFDVWKISKKKNNDRNNNQSENKNKDKKKLARDQCSYCKKLGHWRVDCFKLKNKNKNSEVSELSEQLGSISFQ